MIMFSISCVFALDNSNKCCKRISEWQMEEHKQKDEPTPSENKAQPQRNSAITGPQTGGHNAQSSLGSLSDRGGARSKSAKRFSRNLRCVGKERWVAANTTECRGRQIIELYVLRGAQGQKSEKKGN